METAFANIYSLDKTGTLTHGLVRKIGIYMEIKHPAFHRREGKGNLSEIVLSTLNKYGYKSRTDPVIIQCFDVRRIREELKSDIRLSVLMPADFEEPSAINWNSVEGLREMAKFANGIGPAYPLLIDNQIFLQTGRIVTTDIYKEAKLLKLPIHAYTYRIDQLPPGIPNYETLMKIYVDDLKVEGLFTDFPDLTIQYLNQKNSAFRTTSTTVFIFLYVILASFLRVLNL